jgi:hypothetical protein
VRADIVPGAVYPNYELTDHAANDASSRIVRVLIR